jgi:S-adenosylmethionine/arginine decarboxylase-like enzyme
MKNYGKEIVIDLYDCNKEKCQKDTIKQFCYNLCKEIDMIPMFYYDWEKEGLTQEEWDENPHLQGVSACLFIKTSSITVHAIYGLGKVYINCFSCKDFDIKKAIDYSVKYFEGNVRNYTDLIRY